MTSAPRVFGALFLLALIPAFITFPGAATARGMPGKFSYYALTLSWSPTFCAGPAGRKSPQQCGGKRKFAFVVHGLWPQYTRGWPQHCRQRASFLANTLIRSLYDIMPSKRLIIHEWKKHGTCSGLGAEAYFRLSRSFYRQIRIPARYLSPSKTILTTPRQLVEDFLKTNRLLKTNMVSVKCGNRTGRARLAEIKFCFSRKGKLISCGRNEARRCRASQLVLPPAR